MSFCQYLKGKIMVVTQFLGDKWQSVTASPPIIGDQKEENSNLDLTFGLGDIIVSTLCTLCKKSKVQVHCRQELFLFKY